jgi:hypothetical protein
LLIIFLICCVLITTTFLLFGDLENWIIANANSEQLISTYILLSFSFLALDTFLPVPSSLLMILNGEILGTPALWFLYWGASYHLSLAFIWEEVPTLILIRFSPDWIKISAILFSRSLAIPPSPFQKPYLFFPKPSPLWPKPLPYRLKLFLFIRPLGI